MLIANKSTLSDTRRLQVNINGHQSDPLFAWLKAASGNAVHVPWNFTKFLVIGGDIVKRYSHDVSDVDAANALKRKHV